MQNNETRHFLATDSQDTMHLHSMEEVGDLGASTVPGFPPDLPQAIPDFAARAQANSFSCKYPQCVEVSTGCALGLWHGAAVRKK